MLPPTQPSLRYSGHTSGAEATPVVADYAPGSVIANKYRLDRVLGSGGMGTVWRAHNVVLDVPVALKLIQPASRGSPHMAGRLLAEARVEAKLHHDNIVRVFDFGEAEPGSPFIVMELLEGQTVGDLLEQHGKLDAVAAVQLLLPVIHALGHAHRAGVVHQDLKPDNIFLARSTSGLVPKVLDFGIAKLMSSDVSLAPEGAEYVMGSIAYMAPEQARGLRDVDQRADVFAISEVLYECVSGIRAFQCATQDSMRGPVIEEDVQPLPLDDARTAALWMVLRRGLVRDRDARCASMTELGGGLAAWLHAQGVHADAKGVPLSRTYPVHTEPAPVPNWHMRPAPAVVLPGPATRTRGMRALRLLVLVMGLLAMALVGASDRASDGATSRDAAATPLATPGSRHGRPVLPP